MTEEGNDEEEKLTAKIANINEENSSQDNIDEDGVENGISHIKPCPEKCAAKTADEAATTKEYTDRDSPNSGEDPQDHQQSTCPQQQAWSPMHWY